MNGTIFNIQRFCMNDGPGIRTTVFLKGCPLACVWCHNPEGKAPQKQTLIYQEKCIGCGRCAGLAEDDDVFACWNGARELCGRTVSSDEVVAEVLRDEPFYRNSGGGLTLSGGEPLYQHAFALDILQKAKAAGIHTVVETSGFASASVMRAIAEYTDLFLYDWKETDPELHRCFAGQNNKPILDNLALLNEMDKDIVLRCPIIPGFNDREDHLRGICSVANCFPGIRCIEVEPYHSFGESKYRALGLVSPAIPLLPDGRTKEILDILRAASDKEVKLA